MSLATPTTSRHRVSRFTYGLAVVISPLLLGGATAPMRWLIACLWLSACIAAVFESRARDTSSAVFPAALQWLLFATLVALGATIAANLPLPITWLEPLLPERWQATHANRDLLGTSPTPWGSWSLDPGATRLALLDVWLWAAALAVTAHHLARRGRFWPLSIIATSTTTLSVITLAHYLFAAERVFGLYQPQETQATGLGPLINPNQLGATMILGAFAALALVMPRRPLDPWWPSGPRALWACAALLQLSVAVLSGSYGTLSALGVAAFLLPLVLFAQHRLGRRTEVFSVGNPAAKAQTKAWIAATVVACAGIGGGLGVMGPTLWRGLQHQGGDKLGVAWTACRLSAEHPWLGYGRGSFAAGFVQHAGQAKRFTMAENFPCQWAYEWGWIIATLLITSLIAALFVGALRRTNAQSVLTVGLGAFLVTNLVDFSIEMPGVAVLFFAALTTAVWTSSASGVASPQKSTEHRAKLLQQAAGSSQNLTAHGRLAPALVLVGTLSLVWTLPIVQGRSRRQTEARLREALSSRVHFRAVLQQGLHDHPLEPNLSLIAAGEALRHGDARGILWLHHALALAPQWITPHLRAGAWFASHGHTELARSHLEIAAEKAPTATAQAGCRLIPKGPSWARLFVRASPWPKTERVAYLSKLTPCLRQKTPAARVANLALLDVAPHRCESRISLAEDALGRNDLQSSQSHLGKVGKTSRCYPEALALQGRLALGQGELQQAAKHLEQAADLMQKRGSRPTQSLTALVVVYTRTRNITALRRTYARWQRQIAANTKQSAQLWRRRGQSEQQIGSPMLAMEAYRNAYSLSEQVSDLNMALDVARAIPTPDAIAQLKALRCRRHGSNQDC